MTKISVILSTNNDETLETSLQSILNQTITDIEIICLIDSTQSLDIIEKYSEENNINPIFKSICLGKTLNKCLNSSKGDYIYFLEDNIKLTNKESLEKLYDEGMKNNAKIIGTTSSNNMNKLQVVPTTEYDFSLPIHNNIFSKSFLDEYDLKFPDITFDAYSFFLAETLVRTEKIHLINMPFYEKIDDSNHFYKIRAYSEKEEYVNHFINTFEMLSEKAFFKQLDSYKQVFLDYITYRNNLNDPNLTQILLKHEMLENYFNEEEFGYFFIDYIKHPLKEDENYKIVKECLFEENMLENKFIDVYTLQDFVKYKRQIDKDNTVKNSYKQLLDVEIYTENDKKEAVRSRNNVKNELIYNVSIKNAIFSSNSWKLTNYLRIIKRKIKG